MKPKYEHDCERCVFLGNYQNSDLYFCPQGSLPTVIARWADAKEDPSAYVSGLAFAKSTDMKKAISVTQADNVHESAHAASLRVAFLIAKDAKLVL